MEDLTDQERYMEPTMALLATAMVKVQGGISIQTCRALCDTGAQMNLITKQCAQRLDVRRLPCDRIIRGIGNNDGTPLTERLIADVQAHQNEQFVMTIEFTVIDELMGQLPHVPLPPMNMPADIVLADPSYNIPAGIDMLLGVSVWAQIARSTMYRNPMGTVLHQTEFGYLVLGRYSLGPADNCFLSAFHATQSAKTDTDALAEVMKRFWETEELSKDRIRSRQEEWAEECFIETHYRRSDGRYVVNIPITPEHKPLGDSRSVALKRFLWLEKRLQRNLELQKQYVDFMREYEQLGHMRRVTRAPEPGSMVYYVPHHCVTTKFRVVFDASCKTTTGVSFNDIQLVGEKLQYDLADTFVRFRRHKVAIAADIKKMFRQVCVDPKQWDCQRIFWREDPDEPLQEFWLTVVTYGMSASLHGSIRAMNQCAKDHAIEWPQASEVVQNDF